MSSFYWTNNRKEAEDEQLTLRDLLRVEDIKSSLPYFNKGIAIGSAYDENTKTAFAIGVFFDKSGTLQDDRIEQDKEKVDFPYIPGLLAFRVGPAVCSLLDKIIDEVDILVLDGQGIAHAQNFGLASHIGVLYNKVSIGMTRNILYGQHVNPPKNPYEYSRVLHPKDETAIGYVVNCGNKTGCYYISPGHNISVSTSLEVVLNIARNSSRSFPLAKAHTIARKVAKEYWRKNKNRL